MITNNIDDAGFHKIYNDIFDSLLTEFKNGNTELEMALCKVELEYDSDSIESDGEDLNEENNRFNQILNHQAELKINNHICSVGKNCLYLRQLYRFIKYNMYVIDNKIIRHFPIYYGCKNY